MFRFQCEWADERTTPARSGYELGHMSFAGDEGICTSRGKVPDSVQFRRGGEGRIAVRCGATTLGEAEGSRLCRAILSGVESFLGQPGNPLAGDAPVREDLRAAIDEFARLRV